MSIIHFKYKNHRGEISERKVDIDSLEYLRYPGHDHQPGWFISGFDTVKAARRSFALVNIILPPMPPSGSKEFRFQLMDFKGF